MQVVNKNSYITTIYSATVVNIDKNLDPDKKGRVQIYIPSVNYELAEDYKTYMNSTDKLSNKDLFDNFPWAITLVDDLKNGDEIYGSYIDGDDTQYIILGLAGGVSNFSIGGATISFNSNINGSSIADFAMPIIMYNEIGVELSAWTNDTIPDTKFSSITLKDGSEYDSETEEYIKQGSWSIGLIQWNGVRAYDTCFSIAKEDSNWRNYFTDEYDVSVTSSLKDNLSASIREMSTINQRDGFGDGYNPQENGPTYNAIKKLISSDIGKKVQKQLAYDDTIETINILTSAGCTNPAILIYLADFYNQYGKSLPETTRKSAEACSQEGDMIAQLDWLIINQLIPNFSSFNTYKSRRNATYNYVKELYNTGKLNDKDLTNENGSDNLVITGTGQYCMPVHGHIYISAGFGMGKNQGGQGYSTSPHNGIDFAIDTGTPIYACTSGFATYNTSNSGFGKHVLIEADDGNLLVFGHMSAFNGNNRRVAKGELIGYVGNTGHSFGDHVHLGITDASNGEAGLYNRNIRIR